jgi:hypothetical protein
VPFGFPQSGWDIKDIRIQFDYKRNALHIGINCFGVCGDADGDGDEGSTSMMLNGNGGVDHPKFGGSETVAIAFGKADM